MGWGGWNQKEERTQPWSLGKGDLKHNKFKKSNEKSEKYSTNERVKKKKKQKHRSQNKWTGNRQTTWKKKNQNNDSKDYQTPWKQNRQMQESIKKDLEELKINIQRQTTQLLNSKIGINIEEISNIWSRKTNQRSRR